MSVSIGRDYFEIEAELKTRVEGDIHFDKYSRLLYSTDASIYQIEPIGVVVPRHTGDVQAVIEIANRLGVSVLPRGGGTSLAGQTVGHSIVLDFSKYMQNVLEVNHEELWCRVQPGLVQDELNAYVRPIALQFGPDTSTSNRATIGGMIGNNSAGAHSLTYGKTLDHVLDLTVLLSDGSQVVLKDLAPQEVDRKSRADTIEGRAYREVFRLAQQNKNEILARYPKIMRRVSGYNLDEFIKPQPFNLARMIVGSEGTLATIVEAKMRLVPKPKWTAMDVIHFNDDIEALEAAQAILETAPYALESTDKMILNLARGNIVQSQRLGFVQGNPSSLLMVEYAGETEEAVKEQVYRLEELRKKERIGYAATLAFKPEEVKTIWGVRKAGLGLLLGTKGDKKPIAFVEDAAVAPAKLPEFIKRFREIVARHDTVAGYYGHCSVGCMHIRPLINLKDESEKGKDGVHRERNLSSGARIQWRHVRRAWRRFGAQPLQRAVVWPGALRCISPGQARLRPEESYESGKNRRRAGDDRVLENQPAVQNLGAADHAGLFRARRFRAGGGDVQRHG